MFQFFISDESKVKGRKAMIDGEDFSHLTRSLRMGIGDQIYVVFKGTRYLATIDDVKDTELYVVLNTMLSESWQSGLEVSLFQGLPKGDKIDFIIQKNVEIGVKSFQLIEMEHCVVQWKNNKKMARYQRIALEAAKQSKQIQIPKVQSPIKWYEALEKLKSFEHIVVADETEKDYLARDLVKDIQLTGSVAVVVGPEGGFSEGELEGLKGMGAKHISLGPYVLRTETAGLVLCSFLMQTTFKRGTDEV